MKLIHIKQQHRLPFGMKPSTEYIKSTIKSQFKIMQELNNLPNYPILIESLTEDISYSENSPLSLAAKLIFPNGFPKNIDDLNPLQEEFLYEQGAVVTLLLLGKISIIYKSIHKEVSDKIDKKISQGASANIFVPREIEAIDCAKEAAVKHFKDISHATVIIVFGGFHDFKYYCDEQGFELEVIDTVTHEKVFASCQTSKHTTDATEKQHKCHFENSKSNFFEHPQEYNAASYKLQNTLKDSGMLNDYLTQGYATFEKLIDFQQNKPWIIDALRCFNIYKGICNNYISISQLEGLTKEQVCSIEHKYQDKALQSIVETYLKQPISKFETKASQKENESVVKAMTQGNYDSIPLFVKDNDKQKKNKKVLLDKEEKDNAQEQTSTVSSLSYSPLIEDVD